MTGLGIGVLVAVLAAGLSVWWWVARPGEQRREVSPAELVDVAPPAVPGLRPGGTVDPGRLSSDWGAQQQATASWQSGESVEIDRTVRRYAAPRWADWAFGRVDPRGDERFDDTPQRFPDRAPAGADEARYVCGEITGRPGSCDTWWVDLRYGQYLVQVQGTGVPGADQEIPPWLDQEVARIEAQFAAVVPLAQR
ncbi:hypothetical protein [Saccharopolyspora tripterygii]